MQSKNSSQPAIPRHAGQSALPGRLTASVLFVVSSLLIVGCGRGDYERRLSATQKYLEYIKLIDDNLGPEWNGSGLKIRPPQQFNEIAPPALPVDADGNPIEQAAVDEEGAPIDLPPDPRQPGFAQLPGLAGAWTAQVQVEGRTEPLPAYMYLLTNHDLWLYDDAGDQARAFHDDLIAIFFAGLEMEQPVGDEWVDMTVPQTRGADGAVVPAFVPRQEFIRLTFNPKQPLTGAESEVDIYLAAPGAGDIKVAVIFITPRDAPRSEKLELRKDFALQTLDISPNRPTPDGVVGGGGGGNVGF